MYFNDYLKYVLIFAALVVLLLAVSQYLRHRMDTKYRDLSIIALLLLILICGTQYLSYSERQNFAADTSHMVGFLNALIENQKSRKTRHYRQQHAPVQRYDYRHQKPILRSPFQSRLLRLHADAHQFGQQQYRTHR